MELTIEQSLQQAIVAQQEGQLQEAERLYRVILQSQPTHTDANHNLGVIALSVNKADAALPLFKTALEANPKIEQFWLSYIVALIREKQFDNARQVLEQAKKQGVIGEKVDALEHQLTLITEASNSTLPEQNKKLTLSEKRKKIAANKQQKKKAKGKNANSLNPSQSEVDNLLELCRNERYDQAEKLAVSFTKNFSNNPIAWKVLGILFERTGRKHEALHANQKTVQLSSKDHEAHCNLGVTLSELNRLDEAESSYRQAITLKPDFFQAHNHLGNLLYRLGRLNEAILSYKHSISYKPDYAEAHNNLATILQKLGKLDEADAGYRQAIVLKTDFAEAHNNLGNNLTEMGRLEEAVTIYRQAIALKPNYAEAHSNLANTLNYLGRIAEAEASFRQAITINPNYDLAHNHLGMTLLTLERIEEAVEEFKLDKSDASSSFLLRCFYTLGQKANFYDQLKNMVNLGVNDSLLGSLISRSNIRYKTNKHNPFCNDPLKYVTETNLFEECDFKTIFVQGANQILNDPKVQQKTQKLLTNGIQTSGNILAGPGTNLIQQIIHAEIEKYRVHFEGSNEGLISSWPANYSLNGWIVSMKSGGELSPHMHERGWVSGSIYINVPPKSNKDSGNLVVRLGDLENELDSQDTGKSIDVVTGSLCLFPSSLLHHTIPFESKKDRIVLAFDVIPENFSYRAK